MQMSSGENTGIIIFTHTHIIYCLLLFPYNDMHPFIYIILYIYIYILPHAFYSPAGTLCLPAGLVLDHVRVYIYINFIYNICALWVSLPLVVYDAIDNASLLRAHED